MDVFCTFFRTIVVHGVYDFLHECGASTKGFSGVLRSMFPETPSLPNCASCNGLRSAYGRKNPTGFVGSRVVRASFEPNAQRHRYQRRLGAAVLNGVGSKQRSRASRKAKDGQQLGPVVVIDNYDSFTYNLSQYLGDLGCEHTVFYNDEKTVDEIRQMKPKGILVSPGPGRPEDSGISLQIVEELGPEIPLMGVCMGHQCIGQVFGGKIIRAPSGVMHGKSSPVHHTGSGLLEGLPNPFSAARYHSLVIEKRTCPDVLEVTAWTDDGTIMGVRHKEFPTIQGVQFHPESIITDDGKSIVGNFISSL